MTTEVEARFAAAGPAPLRLLADVETLGPGQLGAARAFEEDDVYLDTTTGVLAASRWACRLRSRGGRVTLSLKGPPDPGTDGWLHRRREVEGPATPRRDPGAWPASSARDLLVGLIRNAPLVERFVLHQHRVERAVSVASRRIGTLTLDTVDVEHAGVDRARIHVVELELAAGTGDEEVIGPLAAALEATPGLTPEPRTKLERAIELIAGP